MKRYIVATTRKLKVGDCVSIVGDGWYAGEWGVIRLINEEDDEYHVAIANGSETPMFSRNELKKMKYTPDGV